MIAIVAFVLIFPPRVASAIMHALAHRKVSFSNGTKDEALVTFAGVDLTTTSASGTQPTYVTLSEATEDAASAKHVNGGTLAGWSVAVCP